MDQPRIEKHTTAQSIILHLLPGVLIGLFYFLTRRTVINLGYPGIAALVLAVALILIPAELGTLLVQGKKKNGCCSLKGIISYKNPVSWWQLLICALIVFGVIGIIMMLLKPTEGLLKEKLFFWMPGLDAGLDRNFSREKLIITYSLYLVFVVILGPLVEELYFRGYLLPRMKWKNSILFHSFLFAAYHTFTPWMIISRTFGFLPLILIVKKKSIYHGMLVHILCNTIDFITAAVFIAGMAR